MVQNTNSTTPHKQLNNKSLLVSFIIGIILFAVLFSLLEIGTRAGWIKPVLNLNSLGVYHSQFEIKWFKLQEYVRENNGVDVLLVGNSMVNTGIDPKILAREYEKQTGEKLRIFNFGVEGLTVAPNSALVKILVEEYHPGSILFVTEMRDYVNKNGLAVEKQFLSDEWISARLGSPEKPRAWFKENSSALALLLPFRNWSRFDFPDTLLMNIRRTGDTTSRGYEADRNTGENIDQPPDPNDPDEKENFELFSNFAIDPLRVENLESILANSKKDVSVFVTEMPLYPTYFDYFGGEPVHASYLSDLSWIVEQHGGVFLPPLSWELIPMEGRVDHHHLNYLGAPLYSELLARQLAESCLKQDLCLRHAPGIEVPR